MENAPRSPSLPPYDPHHHHPSAEQERSPLPSQLYGPPDHGLATSHVGSYTLYSTIGEGAFGKVKIAVNRDTDERFAVKIMDKNEIRAQELAAQVRREIYIMRRLRHKNIVRLVEVLTSETKLYIVMELITGGELFRRIEHGRVPESLARQYFQQLVDGVDFCHKNGVAHRDLKPENLLLNENGDIKITDFGFSSLKGRDVNAGLLYTQCGTPDYCAPEIIESAKEGYNGAKVDAWSCGIILYALLCGRLPFQEQDTDKLYDLILACNVKYPSEISTGAHHLLQNLLVRDPRKRFDLQKVKRHAWFLVSYDGDDAKLIKKRPFFNKNQKELTTCSSPSSPVTGHPEPVPSARASTPRASMLNGETIPSPSAMSGPVRFPSSTQPPPAFPPVTYGEGVDQGSYGHLPAVSTELPREVAHLHQHHQLHSSSPQPQVYNPDASIRHSPLAGRPMPPVPRSREEQYGAYKLPSPANDLDPHARSATPPAHAVFTRVEDRPATPARRQTSAAFKAAKAAAAKHSNPAVTANGHAVPPVSPGFSNSLGSGQSRVSPSGTSNGPKFSSSVPDIGIEQNSFQDAGTEFRSSVEVSGQLENNNDDSSSEQDSIEDYVEKPAIRLELPPDSRLRSAKDSRRTQLSLQHNEQRHRSDLGVTVASGRMGGPHAVDNGPASMSSLQMQRRGFTGYLRDTPGNGSDPRSLRRPAEVPGSPPVVYSPSATNGAPYDRYRSISPGFAPPRPGIVAEAGSPNGVFSALSGQPAQPTAWQSADASAVSAGSFQASIFSRHVWNMICKLRGTNAPAGEKLSQDLRGDLKLMWQELNQLTRPEDIAACFKHFLHLFETLGLNDNSGLSPGGARTQNRSHGTSDMDEEYEDGTTIESREELSTSGETRLGMARRTATDMSSEEEPLSWSPVLAESSRLQSDLARRRNISDLLNKWLKKTNPGPIPNPERLNRGNFVGDEEEPSSTTDLIELQRLMREHHGGREDSNIADEFLRLMDNEGNEDGGAPPFGALQPEQSPPPPISHSSRSADHTQTRFPGNIGNTNVARPSTPLRGGLGSNVPLPSEYVPGRFQEPNSMPARGVGVPRTNGLSSRRGNSDMGEVGNTVGSNRNRDNMASSMGMHDVAYYESDKKNGMTTKLRGVLQTMKTRNQKLGERHAQFKTSLAPEHIMQILGRILMDMGGEVLIKRETKRKMKCTVPVHSNQLLHAGIELVAIEENLTCVAFRRSRADRGRTDTDSFHMFYERVRRQFIEEANRIHPSSAKTRERHSRHRNGHGISNRHRSDSAGHLSLS